MMASRHVLVASCANGSVKDVKVSTLVEIYRRLCPTPAGVYPSGSQGGRKTGMMLGQTRVSSLRSRRRAPPEGKQGGAKAAIRILVQRPHSDLSTQFILLSCVLDPCAAHDWSSWLSLQCGQGRHRKLGPRLRYLLRQRVRPHCGRLDCHTVGEERGENDNANCDDGSLARKFSSHSVRPQAQLRLIKALTHRRCLTGEK
jgi:hypothetical protein